VDHPQDQNQQEGTGLAGLLAPQTRPVPESVPVQEDQPAVTDDFVNIVQVGPPPLSETARKNKEIYEMILAARNQPPAVAPVQPPIPRVLSQTQAEMEEGRRQNERHAAERAIGNIPRRSDKELKAEGTSVPVFRPADFAPSLNSQTDQQRGVRNL